VNDEPITNGPTNCIQNPNSPTEKMKTLQTFSQLHRILGVAHEDVLLNTAHGLAINSFFAVNSSSDWKSTCAYSSASSLMKGNNRSESNSNVAEPPSSTSSTTVRRKWRDDAGLL